MVTYDPHVGIFFRTTKCSQYHVQYFGISAIRGWVSVKSCVPLVTGKEKPFIRKGLSKKIKGEYEVAMQEVIEAAKLDYKQRKLKFIFSFGPSNKRGDRVKQEPGLGDLVLQVKLESQVDTDSGSVSEPTVRVEKKKKAETTRRRSAPESKSNVEDNLETEEDVKPSLRSSGRAKTKELSVSATKHRSKVDGASSPQVVTKRKKPNVTVKESSSKTDPCVQEDGQWSDEKDKKIHPPCLHSEHSLKCSTMRRRSRSDSNPLDCERCLEYITSCEGIELKCTSKPEIFVDSSIETDVQPIRMYVQKQYGDSNTPAPLNTPAPSKASVPPNLNCKPLTKGMSTKNLSTNSMSDSTKQPHLLASHVKGKGGKSGSGKSSSPSPVLSSSLHSSSNGSESGYETGKALQSSLSANSRKRRRRVNSVSGLVSGLGSSPLVEMHTSAEGASVTRKRKRGMSLSSLPLETSSNSPSEDQTSCVEEEAAPTKRVRRSGTKYSQPPTSFSAEKSRRNSTVLKNIATSATGIASASANDTSSEVSTTSLTAFLATPPCSSSDESPSVDFEFDNHAEEPGGVGTIQSSSSMLKEKKKVKQSLPSVSDSKLGVCSICDCEGSDLVCGGHCMNSFHMDCLGLMEEPRFKFKCDECLISSGTCFICGKGHGEVKKCNKSKCSKLYHLECIQGNKLFQRMGKSPSFTCPLHVCAKCTSIDVSTVNHSNLLQCVKCPLALHKPDCLVAGCEVIDQSRMLCYQHVKISKSTNLYSHINLNTCLECGAIGSLYCCDVCSAAYHLECLDQGSRPTSDTNHWKCPSCAVHDLPTYGSLVITKFGVWRCVCVCPCVYLN